MFAAPYVPPEEYKQGEPTRTIKATNDKTTTTLTVELDCEFFMNEASGAIQERGLIINGANVLKGKIATEGLKPTANKNFICLKLVYQTWQSNVVNNHFCT